MSAPLLRLRPPAPNLASPLAAAERAGALLHFLLVQSGPRPVATVFLPLPALPPRRLVERPAPPPLVHRGSCAVRVHRPFHQQASERY